MVALHTRAIQASTALLAGRGPSRSNRIPPIYAATVRRALLLLASVTAAAMAGVALRSRPPVALAGLHRILPQPTVGDPRIYAAVERSLWTQYIDYGTVRIGRVERPARLVTGDRKWVSTLTVPRGGGRYEVAVGATEGPVQVKIGLVGHTGAETTINAGTWTVLRTELAPADGLVQRLAIEIEVPDGSVAAWGSELVVANQPESRPPDVVLISLDTVRRDQLTPYAPALDTTPVLAAFAQQALRFDQAISTSSWTIASHSTLFTGRFPADSLGYQSRVEPGEYTLPEILAAGGYRTFGVSGGPYTDPRWGLHQGFDEYVVSGHRENARDATSRAIEWMDAAGAASVFMFLNYFDAHEPLELSPEVKLASGVSEDVPAPQWFGLDSGRDPVTAAVRHRLVKAYGAELTSIDEQLGRLFEHLRRSGRWDQTLVIVWSDHGQLLGERGNVGHAYTLDEELLRVPLIIKPPADMALPSGVHSGFIQSDDLFALSQALAGQPHAEGNRMLAELRAGGSIRPLAFSKIHHEPLPELLSHRRWRSPTQWAAQDGVTKIIRDLEGRYFAYDVSGSEERPIAVTGKESSLRGALDRFRRWAERMLLAPTVGPLSPEERERLRSLGYIQ